MNRTLKYLRDKVQSMKIAQTIIGILTICLGIVLFILDWAVAQSVTSLANHLAGMIGASGSAAFGVLVFAWVLGGSIVLGILGVAMLVLVVGAALVDGSRK